MTDVDATSPPAPPPALAYESVPRRVAVDRTANGGSGALVSEGDTPTTAGPAIAANGGMSDAIGYASGSLAFRTLDPVGFELIIPPNRIALSYQFRRNVGRTAMFSVLMVGAIALAIHLWPMSSGFSVGVIFYAVMFATCIGYTWWHPTMAREAETPTVVTFDGRSLRRDRPPYAARQLLAEQVRRVRAERLPFSRCGVIPFSGSGAKGFSTGWYGHRDLVTVAEEIRKRLCLAAAMNKAADGIVGLLPADAAPPMPSAALSGRP